MSQAPENQPASWSVAALDKHKTYFPALDGLRGLAILLVVFYHSLGDFRFKPKSIFNVILFPVHQGWVGVPIFFALSGFLVSLPFWECRSSAGRWLPPGYAAKRFIRIIPSCYLTIVLAACAGFFFSSHDSGYFFAGLAWMLGLALYFPPRIDLDGPLWSLVVEIQFYFILPFLFWLCRRWKSLSAVWFIILFLSLSAIISRLILVQTASSLIAGEVENRLKIYLSQLDYFAVGITLGYLFFHRKGFKRVQSVPYPILLAVLAIIIFIFQNQLHDVLPSQSFNWKAYEIRHYFAALGAFILLLVQWHERSIFYYFFSRKWIIYLGAISYEWYLVHLPLINYGRRISTDVAPNAPLLVTNVLAILVSLLFAMAMHHWFFIPVSRKLRHHFIPQKAHGAKRVQAACAVETR